MTLNEFKAWLEGFSEAFEGAAPNADQWSKIVGKLESVKQAVEIKPSITTDVYPRQPNRWFESPNIALLRTIYGENLEGLSKTNGNKTVAPQ